MIATALKYLSGWQGYALALVIGAAAAWTVQGWRYGAEIAGMERDQAVLLEKQAQAVVESVQAARNLEQRRTDIVESERDDAIKKTTSLSVDLAAGRTVSERLRRELSALRARHASGDATTTNGGANQPGTDSIGMLIDMYSGLDATGREVTEYADRIRIAGLACEATYDGVRAASSLRAGTATSSR